MYLSVKVDVNRILMIFCFFFFLESVSCVSRSVSSANQKCDGDFDILLLFLKKTRKKKKVQFDSHHVIQCLSTGRTLLLGKQNLKSFERDSHECNLVFFVFFLNWVYWNRWYDFVCRALPYRYTYTLHSTIAMTCQCIEDWANACVIHLYEWFEENNNNKMLQPISFRSANVPTKWLTKINNERKQLK